MSLFNLSLSKNEKLLAVVRQHIFSFSGSFFQFLILLGVCGAFYYFMPESIWKLIIFLLLLIFSIAFLIFKFVVWYSTCITITDERVIDINQKDLTRRMVTEALLSDISNLAIYKEGIWAGLFNIGTLIIEIKEGGKIVAFNVKDPEGLMHAINQLRKEKNK
ncbi:MAG: hypothetical protein GF335_03300 [Candidatus Moranbacteria bacterium]|nr:hypothetical protein [Candidatus Moranbacteria bacterium]